MIDRIDDIIAAAKKQQHSIAEDAYHASKWAREFASVIWFLGQVGTGLGWCWRHVGAPVWRTWRRAFKWCFWKYKVLWDRVVYKTDPYGAREFSTARAGIMVLATIVFVFVLMGPLLQFSSDVVLYALTAHRNESVVLFSSQEIDIKTNTHNVEGCYEYPCTDGDSFYLRTQNSLFNNVWKLVTTRHLFYPDYVAAAVPTGYSRCVITTYGIRQRIIVANFEVYPQILDVASCTATR